MAGLMKSWMAQRMEPLVSPVMTAVGGGLAVAHGAVLADHSDNDILQPLHGAQGGLEGMGQGERELSDMDINNAHADSSQFTER